MPPWMGGCLVWVLEENPSVLGGQQWLPGSVSGAGRGDLNSVLQWGFSLVPVYESSVAAHRVDAVEECLLG